MNYDPFQTRQRRRRRTIMWALGAAALAVVLALVLVSGVLGQAVDQGEEPQAAPDVSRETSAVPWPTAPTPSVDPSPTGRSSPAPDEVDRTDPGSVSEAFALMTVSWDTPEDRNESPAVARAAEAFGAPELVLPPPPAGESSGWVGPAQQGAYTTAQAEMVALDEHLTEGAIYVPTGEAVHAAQVDVTYRWTGTDPATDEPWPEERREVLLSLVERGGQWWVVEYGYR